LKQYGYCKDSRFRPTVAKAGGKMMFPYLEDPNTRQVMYDSEEIVAYLLKQYGADAKLPLNYRFALTPLGKKLRFYGFAISRMLLRCLPSHGGLRIPARHPIKVSLAEAVELK
jgi:glutathione S-transferase